MTSVQRNVTCPVCGGGDFGAVIRIPDMPLVCNRLYDTPEEAVGAATGDLDLVQCWTCSHIFNSAFALERLSYADGYENSRGFPVGDNQTKPLRSTIEHRTVFSGS